MLTWSASQKEKSLSSDFACFNVKSNNKTRGVANSDALFD